VQSIKYLHHVKQLVTKFVGVGDGYALLDIVCFAGMKREEKQGDGGAFLDLA
jgi:hypothetical protein